MTLPLALVVALALDDGYRIPPQIAQAIANVADTPLEAAELVVWGIHESGLSEHPAPVSWDARAGVSCGFLQLRCSRSTTPEADARLWLADVRMHGEASVCGSGRAAARIAAARVAEARDLLSRAP